MRRRYRKSRAATSVVVALLGGVGGLAAPGARAKACLCATPTWRAHRQSVTSTDPSIDHTAFWPEQAFVSADHSGIALFADAPPGVVRRLESRK
jgi:hypothetical protein